MASCIQTLEEEQALKVELEEVNSEISELKRLLASKENERARLQKKLGVSKLKIINDNVIEPAFDSQHLRYSV